MLQAGILHRIGRELDSAISSEAGYFLALKCVVAELGAQHGTLWVQDERHRVLVRQAQASSAGGAMPEDLLDCDRRLAERTAVARICCEPIGRAEAPLPTVTLPLSFRDRSSGRLQLYFLRPDLETLLGGPFDADNELLRAIAGQLSVFVHTKQRDADSTLQQEMHHRVKNNLQTVESLLRMQARRIDEPTARAALEDSIRRVQAISLVHESLAQAESALVDAGALAQRIANFHHRTAGRSLQVVIKEPRLPLVDSKLATALALVLSELIDNALAHGDAPGDSAVVVTISARGDELEVSVRNRGTLPEGFDMQAADGLGLTIVATLVREELGGAINYRSRNGETEALLTFSTSNHHMIHDRAS